MQTILGSTGIIGKELAKSLTEYTTQIRLVSRDPRKINDSDELFPADLTNKDQALKAVEGSEVVYLVVGLPYRIKIWQNTWPVLMQNVIEACKSHNAKLVFFDNVYSYGKVDGWMTEQTPYKPVSKKGEVRKNIAEMVMREVDKGSLEAMIVRAADFYGPDTPLSVVGFTVIENLLKGKKAQIMGDPDAKHSYTYTPDAGKATALLGNTATAYNQTWHLPTDRQEITNLEFLEKVAEVFEVKPSYIVVKKWMFHLLGLFNADMKELVEMYYQNDSDYLFDSSKFDNSFNFEKTGYEKGIRETVEWYKNNGN